MDLKDKVAFAGAVAAAALAAAKLVAEKESKISDVRRDWIKGLRDALCECLAEAYVIAGRIKIRRLHNDKLILSEDDVRHLEDELTSHWASYRRSFQMVLLHLNFSEANLGLMSRFGKPHRVFTDNEAWRELSDSSPGSAAALLMRKLPAAVGPRKARERPTASGAQLVFALVELRDALLGSYSDVGDGEGREYKNIEDAIIKATMMGNLMIEPEWILIKRGERMHRYAILASVFLVAYGIFKLLQS